VPLDVAGTYLAATFRIATFARDRVTPMTDTSAAFLSDQELLIRDSARKVATEV